jgi:cytochrome c oxidase subunit 4
MVEASLRRHLGIGLALLALLFLNLGLAFLDLGALNPVLALLIPAGQAFLIGVYFMGLREEALVPRLVAAAGFFWLLLMLGLVASDYWTRTEDQALGRLVPESAWEAAP